MSKWKDQIIVLSRQTKQKNNFKNSIRAVLSRAKTISQRNWQPERKKRRQCYKWKQIQTLAYMDSG